MQKHKSSNNPLVVITIGFEWILLVSINNSKAYLSQNEGRDPNPLFWENPQKIKIEYKNLNQRSTSNYKSNFNRGMATKDSRLKSCNQRTFKWLIASFITEWKSTSSCTLGLSTRVSITITGQRYWIIISQKSSEVSGSGPWVAMNRETLPLEAIYTGIW